MKPIHEASQDLSVCRNVLVDAGGAKLAREMPRDCGLGGVGRIVPVRRIPGSAFRAVEPVARGARVAERGVHVGPAVPVRFRQQFPRLDTGRDRGR